jgi:hypothetical protein
VNNNTGEPASADVTVMFSGKDVPEEIRKLVDAVVPKDEATRELLPTVTRICNRFAQHS